MIEFHSNINEVRLVMLIWGIIMNCDLHLIRYTGAGAAVDAGDQQEDDGGPQSFFCLLGEGTGATGHPQRYYLLLLVIIVVVIVVIVVIVVDN